MAVLAPLYGPRLRLANLSLLLPSPSYPMRTCSLCSHSQLLLLLFFSCLRAAALIQTLQEVSFFDIFGLCNSLVTEVLCF